MSRHLLIEDARFAFGEGGMCCGPMVGPVIAEVKLQDEDGEVFFVSLAEVEGYPTFACTPESTIDWQASKDASDEAKTAAFQNCILDVGDEYEEIFERHDSKWFKIFRYLIYLVRCRMCFVEPFIARTKGKYLNSIRIPLSDVEKEWREVFDDVNYSAIE